MSRYRSGGGYVRTHGGSPHAQMSGLPGSPPWIAISQLTTDGSRQRWGSSAESLLLFFAASVHQTTALRIASSRVQALRKIDAKNMIVELICISASGGALAMSHTDSNR